MNNLTEIVLDEISLVDVPANQEAEVVLYKRDTETKSMEDFEKKYTEAKEELDKFKDQFADLKAAVLKEGYSISAEGIEKKAPAETVDIDGEKIAKADVPSVVWDQLKKREDEITELRKKQEMEDLRKRADAELPNLKGTADERAALLKAVESVEDEDLRKSLTENLKAADAACAGAFEEVGKGGKDGDLSDPEAKLEEMTKAHAKDNSMDYYKAYAEVVKTDEGKALIKAMSKKD